MSVARSIGRLGGDTLVYGVAGTIGRFISIFLVPLYTRVFSPAEYGIMAMLGSFTGLVSTLIVLGLDSASARWYYDAPAEGDVQRKEVISTWFWSQMFVGLIVTALIVLFAEQLAQMMLDSHKYSVILILAMLAIPLSTFTKVLINWLRYQRRPWSTMIFTLASSLALIAVTVLFVLVWRWGLAGLYWAQLVVAAGMAAAAVLVLRSSIAPRFISRSVLKEMLVFGLPLVPAAVAAWVTASADRFFLKAYRDATEIGVYAIAVTLASGVALVTNAFQMAWGPFAFSIWPEENSSRVYSKVLSIYVVVGCLLGTAVSLFAPLLLRILTSPAYYGAATSVPWLAFSYLAIGASYIGALGCGIVKSSIPVAVSIFVGAALNTGLNFILIPLWGRDAAAFSTFTAYAAAAVYVFVASQRLYRIPYRFKDVMICLGVSGSVIVADRVLLAPEGWLAFAARTGLCLLFIPLAFWLGIVERGHIRRSLLYVERRLGWAGAKGA